jgi:hypothetical protein
VGDPEHVRVVRFIRWIDDESAKEGMNVIEDFGQRPGLDVNLDLVAVFGGLGLFSGFTLYLFK